MGKMGLKLRRDVQKASYYVWFLGAQEARGLRGSKILLPVIPRLVERSREQEPLKVTLQVSHKGLKIIQGTSKHFIPHSAITCSVQTDDIVACVLLLYNPATRCPLHVHAYRCDSETTALALNQQLQILINRQENQKRFNELETRLGLSGTDLPSPQPHQPQHRDSHEKSHSPPAPEIPAKSSSRPIPKSTHRFEQSPRRQFDSSLGSDTGTSTRESECSEEHAPTSPVMANAMKASLYDSLAAELRAKLSGNGPPLLLPPRDYDTVHRSKGNLAAMELRRCRNISIVGAPNSASKTGVISSRGSSGIGSDLAPSPERPDGHTSSDDDWDVANTEITQKLRHSSATRHENVIAPSKLKKEIFPRSNEKSRSDKTRGDKFISELQERQQAVHHHSSSSQRFISSSSREDSQDSIHLKEDEEEVKPVLNNMRPPYHRGSSGGNNAAFDEKKYNLQRQQKPVAQATESKVYPPKGPPKKSSIEYYDDEEETSFLNKLHKSKYGGGEVGHSNNNNMQQHHGENLTDKQKYRESLAEKRINQIKYQEKTLERSSKERYRDEIIVEKPQTKYREKSNERNNGFIRHDEFDGGVKKDYNREKSIDRKKFLRQHQEDEEEEISPPVRSSTQSSSSHQTKQQQHEVFHNNPYKQSASQPYHESIEKMMKSPVMRYKSIDDTHYGYDEEENWSRRQNEHKRFSSSDRQRELSPSYNYNDEKNRLNSRNKKMQEPPAFEVQPQTKASPKDRFQDAKEKFQAMEREKKMMQGKMNLTRKSSMDPAARRGSMESPITPVHVFKDNKNDDWSSDEEQHQQQQPIVRASYNRQAEKKIRDKYVDVERDPRESSRIIPSKSLGNLVKGYRHSYAEPARNQFPRASGRVGLAAVNPF